MRIVFVLGLSAALLSCHDKSDDAVAASILLSVLEAEPNNSAPTASPLSASGAGNGAIATAGDLDFWRFEAVAGQVIRVELHAVRLDQAGWIAAAAMPELRLLAADGATELLRTEEALIYFSGTHDSDFFAYRVAATGTHFIRISTDTGGAGGKYALALSTLSYPAFQSETEANDTAATANAIVPGVVYANHVDDEDDFYSFSITEATIVTFEMQSYRNSIFNGDDEYFDTEIELIDTDQATVLLNNDDAFYYDSSLRFLLTTPGTYYLRVTECCGAGDADYFLVFSATKVGVRTEAEPNDVTAQATPLGYGEIISANHGVDDDLFSFQGTAGDMVQAFMFDLDTIQAASANLTYAVLAPDGVTVLSSDYGSGDNQVLRTILQQSGTHFIRVTGPTATMYAIQLVRYRVARFESEANNSTFTADSLDDGDRAAGAISTDADVDFFRFTATAGQLVTIQIHAASANDGDSSDGHNDFSGWGSTLDPRLRIFSGALATLADSRTDSLGGGDPTTESIVNGLATAQVSFIAPATGEYFIVVSADNLPASATHFYVIEKR